MIRVFIVDDHEIVRGGLRLLLQDTNQIEVVGEAGSGEEAIHLARQLKPDVVLMDINMPGIGGLEATMRLLRNEPKLRVLIISAHFDDILPARLIQIGAGGYISKTASPAELLAAIKSVHDNTRYIDPSMINRIVLPRLGETDEKNPLAALTERELQVLLMVARGISVNDIAKKLFLSNKTINGYRSTIFKKLGVKTDVEATRIAIANGLIDVDSQWH